MSRIAFLSLILLTALCGCAHNYVITLNNGRRITTASKPRLDGGKYTFKDGLGRPASVSTGQVREIAPASMMKEEKPMFNPQPKTNQ